MTLSLPAPTGGPRPTAAGETARYIRRLIFDGALTEGSRIPQDEIAAVLGISRIPVREALISLERDGWVRIEPHRGAFVNALTEPTVRDHFEVFGLIYGLVAQRGTERGSPESVAELISLERELSRAKEPADVVGLMQEFTSTLTRAAGSPRLTAVLRGMNSLVPGNIFELIPGATDASKRGISRMLSCIKLGDGERAAEACLRMNRALGDTVIRELNRRGLFHQSAADGGADSSRPPPVQKKTTHRRSAEVGV
jgi:DNA-binding GntR family transcriptional regulator